MWILTLSLMNLVAALGITIVVPLISVASDIFGVDQATSMWIVTAFMLTYASFMPILGRFSDIYGRRKVLLIASSIFSLGLLISSTTSNFWIVILGRAVQGFGAGGILPIANAMVIELMKDRKEHGLSIINATYGLGMIVGVNLGGILYDYAGWRYIFIVPFVLNLIFILIGIWNLKESLIEKKKESVDLIGSILFATFIGSLMLFIKNLGASSISDPHVLSYLGISIVSFILFFITEMKVKHPAIDIKAFKNMDFLIYNLVALAFGIAMFITVTFMAPFVQVLLGYDVSTSVYAIDPFALSMALFIMVGGKFSQKIGAKATMSVGMFSLFLFELVFSYFTTGAVSFYILSILVSIGLGLPMTPMNHIVMEAGGKENQGRSAGLVSIMRSIGGMIGPALAGFVFSRTDFSSIFAMDNLIQAYSKVFLIGTWSAFAGFIFSIIGLIKRKKTLKGG